MRRNCNRTGKRIQPHIENAPDVLSIQDLRFSYNGKPVMNGFDFRVAEEELVGLVGPNGTGKTTLIRLMSGVLQHGSGAIWLRGSKVNQMKARQRARLVSVVPQNPTIPLGLTAFEVALLGRNPHLGLLQWEDRRDAEIAMEALEATGTAQLAQRKIDSLSGGERQRVLIAMALAQQAPVMLLDEPTSSLDIANQPAIMELLDSLRATDGSAVVVAMHDLTLAAQFCDRIVVIHEGRNFAEGSPSVVLTEKMIQTVYKVKVRVLTHPDTGLPVVVGA